MLGGASVQPRILPEVSNSAVKQCFYLNDDADRSVKQCFYLNFYIFKMLFSLW